MSSLPWGGDPLGSGLIPDVREKAEFYQQTLSEMFSGTPADPSFIGWVDPEFHRYLARQLRAHHDRYITAEAKAIKFEGACAVFGGFDISKLTAALDRLSKPRPDTSRTGPR